MRTGAELGGGGGGADTGGEGLKGNTVVITCNLTASATHLLASAVPRI
jgi:hypothetical protein